MPRAAHGVVDHEPVDNRTVIMRVLGPDREYLCPAAYQEYLLAAGMPDQFAAVGKLEKRKALRQIGTAKLALVLSHSILL